MRVIRSSRRHPEAVTDSIDLDDRACLLRLCTCLVRDSDVAEDLALETLIEDWTYLDRLRTPDQLRP